MDGNNHEPLLEERRDEIEATMRTRQTVRFLELHRDDWMWEGPRCAPVGLAPIPSECDENCDLSMRALSVAAAFRSLGVPVSALGDHHEHSALVLAEVCASGSI
jgi:hypothetical protein